MEIVTGRGELKPMAAPSLEEPQPDESAPSAGALPGGFRLSWVAGTDVGLKRADNQDSFLASPPFFLVADGMGGHAGGKQASATLLHALEPFCGRALSAEKFHRLLATACREVMDLADANLDYSISPPGTTLTGLVLVNGVLSPIHEAPSAVAGADSQTRPVEDLGGAGETRGAPHAAAPPAELLVVNVGDSRTYVLEGGQLRQLTRDHSQVAQMLEAGLITPEMVQFMPNRSVITRAIGAGQTVLPQIDTWRLPLAGAVPDTGNSTEHNAGQSIGNSTKTGADPGETDTGKAGSATGVTGRKASGLDRETRRFLVCSDGLHSLVRQALIERVLADADTPEEAVKSLIEAALGAGGLDNVTVVVLDIEPAAAMAPHETASSPTKEERE